MLLEVCVDSIASAIAAERGGAERIELCSCLAEGGVTPSVGLIKQVLSAVSIPVHVLIRPRSGDFLYTASELAAMCEDIRQCAALGVTGVVSGALKADGTVDEQATALLLEAAGGPAGKLSFSFHRAIDMTRDPVEALQALMRLGIRRVLTSGGVASAPLATEQLKRLIAECRNRVVIMPGGGITECNVYDLVAATGVREVHASARSFAWGGMEYRRQGVTMGAPPPPGLTTEQQEYGYKHADASKVAAIRAAAEAGERRFAADQLLAGALRLAAAVSTLPQDVLLTIAAYAYEDARVLVWGGLRSAAPVVLEEGDSDESEGEAEGGIDKSPTTDDVLTSGEYLDVNTGLWHPLPSLPANDDANGRRGAAICSHGSTVFLVGGINPQTGKPVRSALYLSFPSYAAGSAAFSLPPLCPSATSSAPSLPSDAAGSVTSSAVAAATIGPGHASLVGGWVRLPDMMVPRAYCATVVHEGRLYALGGLDERGRPLRSVECLDLTATGGSKWQYVASMTERRAHFQAFSTSSRLYVLGEGEAVRTCEWYDTKTRTWTVVEPIEHKRNCPGAALLEPEDADGFGRLVIPGGYFNRSASYRHSEVFRPLPAASFTPLAEPRIRRSHAAVAGVRGAVYLIGGIGPEMDAKTASYSSSAAARTEGTRGVGERKEGGRERQAGGRTRVALSSVERYCCVCATEATEASSSGENKNALEASLSPDCHCPWMEVPPMSVPRVNPLACGIVVG